MQGPETRQRPSLVSPAVHHYSTSCLQTPGSPSDRLAGICLLESCAHRESPQVVLTTESQAGWWVVSHRKVICRLLDSVQESRPVPHPLPEDRAVLGRAGVETGRLVGKRQGTHPGPVWWPVLVAAGSLGSCLSTSSPRLQHPCLLPAPPPPASLLILEETKPPEGRVTCPWLQRCKTLWQL